MFSSLCFSRAAKPTDRQRKLIRRHNVVQAKTKTNNGWTQATLTSVLAQLAKESGEAASGAPEYIKRKAGANAKVCERALVRSAVSVREDVFFFRN
jgi:hypothetical protein